MHEKWLTEIFFVQNFPGPRRSVIARKMRRIRQEIQYFMWQDYARANQVYYV